MKNKYTLEEVNELAAKLIESPKDTDLMNKLAIGYLTCAEAEDYDKVDELFKRAFEINPSIKTAHNYAYQIITDWDDYDLGISILKPFVDKTPNSYMPFFLLGYAYLEIEDYTNAKQYFEKAMVKSDMKCIDAIHNLGVCECYFGNYEKALCLFNMCPKESDEENQSKFNRAVCLVLLGENEGVNEIIQEIKSSEEYKLASAWVSCSELGKLSFLKKDMKQAYELFSESRYGRDLLIEIEFSYLLFRNDKSKFDEIRKENIESLETDIAELNDQNDEGFKDWTQKEKEEKIEEVKNEIYQLEELEKILIAPPVMKVSDLFQTRFTECLLYDCKMHGNQFDD